MNPSYRDLPGIHASPNIQTAPDVYEVENLAADPEQRVEQAMQAIADWTGKTMLDLGAGTGFHSRVQSVVRLEFGDALAAELLAQHEGLQISYQYILYWRTYSIPGDERVIDRHPQNDGETMTRDVRYQAAIIYNQQILLIQHREHASGRSYWLLPGGGREGDETPEQCLLREINEETHLTITVEHLLLDDPAPPGAVYQRFHTYLCRPSTLTARPGMEPEPEAAALYSISAVTWCPLEDETGWHPEVAADPITAPLLRRILAALRDRAAG